MKKYTIAPNGIKITIRAISSASFPSNLLLKISIIAITGSSRAKINITGIKKNNNIVLIISVKFKSLSSGCLKNMSYLDSTFSINPSLICIIRRVSSATERSWVTMIDVSPLRFNSLNTFITSTDVTLSKAPVGSSASRILGCEIMALAMATRCFRPPYRDWETDRKSTRLNSSHITRSRMPSSA